MNELKALGFNIRLIDSLSEKTRFNSEESNNEEERPRRRKTAE